MNCYGLAASARRSTILKWVQFHRPTLTSRPFSVVANDKDDPNYLWFKDGLKFSCNRCGNCCSGSSGSVRFNDKDEQSMADFKGVDVQQLRDTYTRKRGRGKNAHRELKEVRTKGGYDCVFLERSQTTQLAICGLYEHRPVQCRTFPFWDDIVATKESWHSMTRGKEGCKGMGKGKLRKYDDIVDSITVTNNWRENL